MIYNYPDDYDLDYCSEDNTECYDYVEVSFGSYNEKFCGSEVPDPITSTDNTMTVRFFSDGSLNYPGFSAMWGSVQGAFCNVILILY